MKEETINSRTVFAGRVLTVRVDQVRLSDGRETEREIVDHPASVAILAVDGQRLLLVRQYRYAVGEELLELPAGKMERGESPEEAARRELAEETGYRAEKLRLLGRFYSSPGFSGELMYIFLAENPRPGTAQPDVDEHLEPEWVERTVVLEALRQGRIRDGKTALGLSLLPQ